MRKIFNGILIVQKNLFYLLYSVFLSFCSYPFFKLDFIICKQLLYLYLFFIFGVLGYDSHQKKSNIQYFYYVLMLILILFSLLLWIL